MNCGLDEADWHNVGLAASANVTTEWKRFQLSGARSVWALDGSGNRDSKVPASLEHGRLTFTVGPKYHTLWYEISP